MIKIIKRKKFLVISAIALLVVIVGYLYFGRNKQAGYDFVLAKRGGIIQEVSVTGHIKPAEDVNLAFEKSGKVSYAYVKVGDKISVSQKLITLENYELLAQLNQAKANLKIQQSKLEELRQGTRPEEIQVQEVKVENARIALEDANKNLIDKLQDAYTKSDDAIRNKTDGIFDNPRTQNPQLKFTLSDNQLETTIEWQRFLIETVLISWKSSLDVINTDKNLEQIKLFLDEAAFAVNNLTPNSALSQTTIDTWKLDVSTARTNVNTAIVNFSAAEEKSRTAESNLTLAQNELYLKKAGTVTEQIDAQEAEVEQSEANVQNYQAQLAKTILYSPISGVVTKQETKIGEIVSANTIVVSIISVAKFEIETNVPEADIAKVKISAYAKVTLDAYGNDVVFEAKVIKIDPAETIIEGVATYKTTLQFAKEDERLKSGMTANIDILADKRENVIIVPQRAITTQNNDKIVKILEGENTIKEVKVKIGLRGSDGNVEITEGINEGDKVVSKF